MLRRPTPPLTKQRALICASLNLLVLPGSGSWLGGRRTSGMCQILLAFGGFALTVMWFVDFIATWLRLKQFPLQGGDRLGLGVAGIFTFGAAWLWSAATSWRIWQRMQTASRPPIISLPMH